ncbi:InlB B-repeat-containing protein [Candidatus Methanoplasma termitum]|uniref:InlB B-repeat-containing protein n=1 Tax=Candidatus Methanoplasma termitum TaxID=1577791 RepID=UPI00130D4CF1|nr:transglutaminase-like domain-containing protein [Candidatus Methanoplasma termitum]MCL2333579.1 transglutaminase-like domain-containing protein [Candidatus Methanoplasma sp.]
MVIVVCTASVLGVMLYSFSHVTNINEYNSTHVPNNYHKISLFENYLDAGTLSSTGGYVQHGGSFVCTVTPTSSQYVFDGWYSDQTLVSTSNSFKYVVECDSSLEARFHKVSDAAFRITQTNIEAPTEITLTPISRDSADKLMWSIEDMSTLEELNYADSGNNDGSITCSVSNGCPISISLTTTHPNGESQKQNLFVIVNEDMVKSFVWRYQEDEIFSEVANVLSINNGAVSWSLTIPYAEEHAAEKSTIPRDGASGAYDVIADFVTADNPVIMQMADDIEIFTAQMSDVERVDFVLKFVQSIPFEEDIASKGVNDYYKLPVETLWQDNGDCEDHAILFAAMMKAMDYKVVLYHVYIYSGSTFTAAHVAAGVAVDGGSGYYTTLDGEKYYYCESTAEVGSSWVNQADVGYIPSGYKIVETWIV